MSLMTKPKLRKMFNIISNEIDKIEKKEKSESGASALIHENISS